MSRFIKSEEKTTRIVNSFTDFLVLFVIPVIIGRRAWPSGKALDL